MTFVSKQKTKILQPDAHGLDRYLKYRGEMLGYVIEQVDGRFEPSSEKFVYHVERSYVLPICYQSIFKRVVHEGRITLELLSPFC